jgi:aminopeptidase N
VGWKSYRDQWISETFAEYASFLFMTQYEGEKSYSGRLEYWEKGARRTKHRAPMVLGSRDRHGYQGQVYRRGPYVLHMLRRMVGDEPFTEFMRQVTSIAANRNLSTGDLETIAAKVLGPDVHWFFEQWIATSGLPELEATWEMDGKKLRLVLKQTQSHAPYRLLVPVVVNGPKGKALTHTVAIDAREIEVLLRAPRGGVSSVKIDPDRELLTGSKKVVEKKKDESTSE